MTNPQTALTIRDDMSLAQLGDFLAKSGYFKDSQQAGQAIVKVLAGRERHDLDTEKLLRVNDAGTIADLQRRLREAEGQLKARRLSAENVAEIRAYEPRWAIDAKKRAEVVAENTELRRTISLMAKTAAEVQDNFRLIAELAADPADEKRKEPKP